MDASTTIRFMGFRSLKAEFKFRQLQILLVGIVASLLAGAAASPLSAQIGSLDPQVRWRVFVPGRALTNYVATAPNGTVYVNSDERLMALDPGGNLQWEVLNTSNREARPINVRVDGSLVVGGLGFGQVTALHPDGSLMWAYNSSGNRLLAGPSLGPDGNVYAVANDLGTFSLDAAGNLRWVGDYYFSTDQNNSPLVFDSSRFFAGLAGFTPSLGLYVYDLDNGQEVWSSASLELPWNGYPVLDPSGRVIGPRFPTWVQALEPEDGQVVWASHHPGQVNFLLNQPKVGTNGVVYTSDRSGADLWAINPDGTTLWYLPHGPDTMHKVTISPDNTVIVALGLTSDNQTGTSVRWFRGYDSTNGAQLWQIDLPAENGISPGFPGFDVVFTPDSRTAYITTSYFAAAGNYGYLYAIDIQPAVVADSFLVTLGTSVSGGLTELAESDDQYLVLDPEFLTFRYQLEFTVDATSPSESPSALDFNYESRAFSFVGTVDQKIELFNYDSGQFETVDTRPTLATDSVVNVTPSGDPTRFVEAGTNAMQARISYQNSLPFWVFSTQNLYLPYRVRADHLYWTITP